MPFSDSHQGTWGKRFYFQFHFYLQDPEVAWHTWATQRGRGERTQETGPLLVCELGVGVWFFEGFLLVNFKWESGNLKQGKRGGKGSPNCQLSESTKISRRKGLSEGRRPGSLPSQVAGSVFTQGHHV